jgi:hypothetical protein
MAGAFKLKFVKHEVLNHGRIFFLFELKTFSFPSFGKLFKQSMGEKVHEK